jgi:hypothetical protein
MHSHQGQYILYYINHQSINPLTSINHLTSINQTIGINDNMIQQHPVEDASWEDEAEIQKHGQTVQELMNRSP